MMWLPEPLPHELQNHFPDSTQRTTQAGSWTSQNRHAHSGAFTSRRTRHGDWVRRQPELKRTRNSVLPRSLNKEGGGGGGAPLPLPPPNTNAALPPRTPNTSTKCASSGTVHSSTLLHYWCDLSENECERETSVFFNVYTYLTGPLFPIGIEHLIYMKFFCYGSSNDY